MAIKPTNEIVLPLRKGERLSLDGKEWELLTDSHSCPFCDGEYAAAGNVKDESELGVWHTVPYCAEFEHLEADRFMEAARVRWSAN